MKTTTSSIVYWNIFLKLKTNSSQQTSCYPGEEVPALEGEGGVTEESDEDGEGPGGHDQPDGDLVHLAGHHQHHLPLLQDSPESQAKQDTPA